MLLREPWVSARRAGQRIELPEGHSLRPEGMGRGEEDSGEGEAPLAIRHRRRTRFPTVIWADLTEDKIKNPAPGFWPAFGPLGPTAGPGSPGSGPGSKNSAGCNKIRPGEQF